jgi:hypothetical protein
MGLPRAAATRLVGPIGTCGLARLVEAADGSCHLELTMSDVCDSHAEHNAGLEYALHAIERWLAHEQIPSVAVELDGRQFALCGDSRLTAERPGSERSC